MVLDASDYPKIIIWSILLRRHQNYLIWLKTLRSFSVKSQWFNLIYIRISHTVNQSTSNQLTWFYQQYVIEIVIKYYWCQSQCCSCYESWLVRFKPGRRKTILCRPFDVPVFSRSLDVRFKLVAFQFEVWSCRTTNGRERYRSGNSNLL